MLKYQEILDKIDQLEEAHILTAALEFRIFSVLGKKSLSARAVARKAGTHPEGTEMLLNALAAMGALYKRKERYSNTSETYRHFCETSPHYKKGMVMLRREHRKEWDDLTQIIRSGRDLSQYEGGDDPEFRWYFTHAMHERSELRSARVAEVVAAKPVGRLLDLGGGPGSYSAAILRKDRKGRATLLDRPATLNAAREILKKTGTLNRFEFIPGDIFETDYGKDYDTVFYSNVLHIYNPKENRKIFRKIHRSLKKGGRFILVDLFLHENKTAPYEAALFSLTMLLFTATGKSYTFKETEALLRSTGFGAIKRFDVGLGSSLIESVKK